MSDVLASRYRFAGPGELSDGCTAAMRATGSGAGVVVVVERGEATQQLLDHLGGPQGVWVRLPNTPENRVHPQRVLHAGWVIIEGEALPADRPRVFLWHARGRHEWLIRERHATVRLAVGMTWLLTRMVRNEVWIQGRTGEGAGPDS